MRIVVLCYYTIRYFFYYYYSPFYELSKLANSMFFLFFTIWTDFFSSIYLMLFTVWLCCLLFIVHVCSPSSFFLLFTCFHFDFFLFIYFFVYFLSFYFTFIPSDHHQWTSDAHQSCYIFTCAYKNVVVGFGLKDKIPIRKYLSISHIQRAIICRLRSYQNTCVDPLHTHRTIWHIHSHFLHRCFSIFSIFPVRTDFGEMLRFHK